jgi:thiamine-phosphate pyrophosphorylase
VASEKERATLAAAARALNANNAPHLPALILMTDQDRLADPLAAARGLPHGSAVIVRHRQAGERAVLARMLLRIAEERGLRLSIADDPALAQELDVGLHLPEARASKARVLRECYLLSFVTAGAHSAQAVEAASKAGVDAVLLSPLFATRSHPKRAPLGIKSAATIARNAKIPVYALGGIDMRTVARLEGTPFAGIAAIGALAAG